MKKTFLLIAVILGVAYVASEAAPRLQYQVTKTYRNDGNTRQGFSATLSTTSWTAILPASETRRYAIFTTTSSAYYEICLSTVSASATTCLSTMDGRHMPRIGNVVEDFSEAPLYGRVIAGDWISTAISVLILGEKDYDTGD